MSVFWLQKDINNGKTFKRTFKKLYELFLPFLEGLNPKRDVSEEQWEQRVIQSHKHTSE